MDELCNLMTLGLCAVGFGPHGLWGAYGWFETLPLLTC